MSRLAGISKDGRRNLFDNFLRSDKTRSSLFADAVKTTHASLRPGRSLDRTMNSLSKALPVALEEYWSNQGNDVDLWEWLKYGVVIGVTEALYGEDNPFQNSMLTGKLLCLL